VNPDPTRISRRTPLAAGADTTYEFMLRRIGVRAEKLSR